jgi:hypothetical protein
MIAGQVRIRHARSPLTVVNTLQIQMLTMHLQNEGITGKYEPSPMAIRVLPAGRNSPVLSDRRTLCVIHRASSCFDVFDITGNLRGRILQGLHAPGLLNTATTLSN